MPTSVGVQKEPKGWITLRSAARSSWLEHVARRWTARVIGQPQATDSFLLGVLDRAEMNNGRNRHVDFSSCLFFFTSYIGSKESLGATAPSGFIPQSHEEEAEARHFRSESLRVLKRHFPPEFLRRIEETIVYQPLRPTDLKKIHDLELDKARQSFLQHPTAPFQVEFTSNAKSLLLHHGCDTEYGAAYLQHTLACEFQDPLYRLMATGQERPGDKIGVFVKGSELLFRRC